MRLGIRKDGSFEISEMREIEFHLLEQVAAASATGECEAARRRIFPDTAISPDNPSANDASMKDWRELIVPELEAQFKGAVKTVEDDLKEVESEVREGEEKFYRVAVPVDHAEAWYSALNQARLVLAENHELPMSEEELEAVSDSVDERWLAYAQSNIYAFIQSFLLETALRIQE